ncbi:MAG: ABC transporter permease [Firmicutes bacterium]|nr:ABC transporter permease [Bacillota bacterium]
MSTPILLAALGLIVTELANITNIGVEGIMLVSAFIAVAASYWSGSWVVGILAAVVAGVLIAALMALIHLKFKADVFVAGIAINLFSLAFTRFLLKNWFGVAGSFYSPRISPIPRINLSFLQIHPVIDTLFNNYNLMDYLAIVLVFVFNFLIYKTVWGLRLRFTGVHPAAVETGGISVTTKKLQALLISGVLGGLAGAHLSLGYTTQFIENMTNGRGFIGVAAMYFGGVAPITTWLASLFFGFTEGVGARLQTMGFPSQFILMMPYVATVFAITFSMIRQQKKLTQKQPF